MDTHKDINTGTLVHYRWYTKDPRYETYESRHGPDLGIVTGISSPRSSDDGSYARWLKLFLFVCNEFDGAPSAYVKVPEYKVTVLAKAKNKT
jgi:hypothetical protein